MSSAALYTSTQAEAHVISRVHVSGVSMFPVSWNRYPAGTPSEVSHSSSWQGGSFLARKVVYTPPPHISTIKFCLYSYSRFIEVVTPGEENPCMVSKMIPF